MALVAVALSAAVSVPGALADDHWVWTPLVTTGVNSDTMTEYVDFTESTDPTTNPTPMHGYVIVHADGTITCGWSGGPRQTSGDGHEDPTFVDSRQCSPPS